MARSGGSIFEIAAHGRPAILIPYPHATGDHQTANARWMADAGAAIVIPDAELTPERLRRRRARSSATRRACSAWRASAALARPHAAADVADEVLAAAAGRRRGKPVTEE